MAKLILVKLNINPSSTCPATVNVGYKFFGQPVGALQYQVPRDSEFTFPGGGAESIPFAVGGKLFLYINNTLASMGAGLIRTPPTAPNQLKLYNNSCGFGTFTVKYKVI